MAQELPWFKFYCDEWLTGDITLEKEATQGLFISVCAYYWKQDCNTTLDKLKKRYRHINNKSWSILLDNNLIKLEENNKISIKFLDKQLRKRVDEKEKKRVSGIAGAKKRWHTHSTPIEVLMAKDGNIDRDKDKEVDKDKDKEYTKEFLAFWDYYGKVGNKKSSSNNWNNLNPSQIEDIRTCIPAYILNTNTNGEYPSRKNAETYLNKDKEYWNDSIIFKNSGGNNNNSIFESRV